MAEKQKTLKAIKPMGCQNREPMPDEQFMEMAKSLGCILEKEYLIHILWCEQWTTEEIEAFIEKCEG